MAESELLGKFCKKYKEAALDLARAIDLNDTLHPIHEGRAFRWRNEGVKENVASYYGRRDVATGPLPGNAALSPNLLQSGGEVPELIGDGTLAIFRAEDPAKASAQALEAEANMREKLRALLTQRLTVHEQTAWMLRSLLE